MAKTIKELALKAYPVKMVKTYGYLPGGDITEKDENLLERIAMEKGANAVLSEIEKLVKFNRWAAQDLYELIEQLKK